MIWASTRFQGIPILKTLVVWASPSHVTLAIWVAGYGDAQNADMPIPLWHRALFVKSNRVFKAKYFFKPIHPTDGAPIYICINVTASWLRLRLGQSCVALHCGTFSGTNFDPFSRVTYYEAAGWLQFTIFLKIDEIERLVQLAVTWFQIEIHWPVV